MSLAPAQENKTAWACIFSRQVPRYFADTICLSWGFLRWLFLKTRRARISLMRFTFLVFASRLPFSLPNSILYQVHPENFRCVPPKRSFPILQLSTEWYSLDLNFVLHNLGRFFFFSDSNCSLSTFFSTSRSSYHQFVAASYECICFQNCNHDTRDDVDNHTTIFFILLAIGNGFLALVARLAFGLFKLFRQSVSSLSVLKRMLAQGENFLRISTSFHVVLTVLRGMPRV